MPTPKKGDAPVVDPTDAPIEPDDQLLEPSEPVEPEPYSETPLDERFQGKSAEEVIADYKNLESHAGRLAQQLDEAKTKAELQSLQPTQQNSPSGGYPGIQSNLQQNFGTQPQAVEIDRDADFIDQPTKTSRELIREELMRFSEAQRYTSAFQQADNAERLARQSYPQVFEGIDSNELRQTLFGGVQAKQLAPEVLSSPDGWRMAAWELKGRKLGFQITVSPTPTIPPAPVSTENPLQSKPPQVMAKTVPQAPAGFREEVWDKMGVTAEEGEAIKKHMAEQGRK